ncbi:hypothetical protein Glove_236g1 [Diversispora epigaea]|uniref:Protein kinase domain-containing protein n=1 Tax=Diversispora epigaea TaxID=1348612 RepID=A0A397IGG1_9GLOM|nr:hypothetical protein Glove_236g1 [Diversispora epigaea]
MEGIPVVPEVNIPEKCMNEFSINNAQIQNLFENQNSTNNQTNTAYVALTSIFAKLFQFKEDEWKAFQWYLKVEDSDAQFNLGTLNIPEKCMNEFSINNAQIQNLFENQNSTNNQTNTAYVALKTLMNTLNVENATEKEHGHQIMKIKDPHLIWVPFEEFKDVKKIGQGGFSQIFKATWNDGIDYRGNVKWWSKSEQEIVLKVLNNSQNVDTEFLNELKHTFQFMSNLNSYEGSIIKCYGVTQDPQTKNYAFVSEYIPNGDLLHFINKT